MSTFRLLVSSSHDAHFLEILSECEISPIVEAAVSIQEVLCMYPETFITDEAMAFLTGTTQLCMILPPSTAPALTQVLNPLLYAGLWEATYAARSRNEPVDVDAVIALSIGICHVLAALPEGRRVQSFQGLVAPSLQQLERMSSAAKSHPSHLPSAIVQLADEIRILATVSKTFANATSSDGDAMESGCDTSPDRHVPVQEPVLAIVQKGWPIVVSTANDFCDNDVSGGLLDTCSHTVRWASSHPPRFPLHRASLLPFQLCCLRSCHLTTTTTEAWHC